MALGLTGETALLSPLFLSLRLNFQDPRTQEVIRLADCVVKWKDGKVVNMPEDTEEIYRGVVFLLKELVDIVSVPIFPMSKADHVHEPG